MDVKSFFKILLLSLLVMLASTPLRARPLGFAYSSLIGFVVFFIFSMICLKRFKSRLSGWQMLAALLIGQWIFELPMRVTYFNASLLSLPDTLIRSLGIICAYLYSRLGKPFNTIPVLVGFLITVFMFVSGWDMWKHKLNYGTFTGQVTHFKLASDFELRDASENTINVGNFQNKLVVLDFWYTTCGLCFEKFPKLQLLYDRYKDDPNVLILAVNTPIQEDTRNKAFEMISTRGYTFPVVIARGENLPEKFGIDGYPTTFVIDTEGLVVFKGSIEEATKEVDELRLTAH